MEYVALDLETTGLDPGRDGVIEAGAVAFDGERVIGRFERLANPGRRIPDPVVRLTGIRDQDVREAPPATVALAELTAFCRDRQVVGHGAGLDLDFLTAGGHWEPGRELLDTLDIARILIPHAASHSLPVLAADLGLEQPRPHRALDDADATRQLLLRLREVAAGLDEELKEKMLALTAPYGWAIASFFSEALTAASPLLPEPQRPPRSLPPASERRRPPDDDPELLVELLGPQGPLAAALPDYELREQQQEMLRAVAQIMRRGGRLVVEAGTGTGKSLAYLVPAIARALRHGERVVVSTHTHTLQEQLMSKDLPGLRSWLPWDFEACLLKGRTNYVSLRRWRRYIAEPCQDSDELRFKLKVMVWLHQTETGDRSELRLQGREEVFWARIASDPLDCVGIHCTAADCFVHRARAEAEQADVVVVNHALLLADAQTAGGILPPFDHLVIDEAHHLEDAATAGLRQEVDGPGLLALLLRLAVEEADKRLGLIGELLLQPRLGEDAGLVRALEGAFPLALGARARVERLFEIGSEWLRRRLPETERRDESLRLVPALREEPDWAPVHEAASAAATALGALDAELRRAVAAGRDWLLSEDPDPALRELEVIRGRLAEAGSLLHAALVVPEPNTVHWFTLLARSSAVALRAAPLNVGRLLRDQVYADRASIVFTSASLAVGGSFDYFCSRAGLIPGEIETLLLASPFDYLKQALVCLPTDIPEPQAPDFEPLVTAVVADVARRIGGRTLVLFTSHQQLRDVHTSLRHRHDLDDVLILGQGVDGQRRALLRSFTEHERALLLGTSSFWEGVDVPGDRLSCVIVVRLPFPVPTEPVFAARAEQVRDAFTGYALPLAALRLKQGFGRLIRRGSDRGAVVILDSRISSRDYGQAFLEVLPPASRYRGPVSGIGRRVEEWLAQGAALTSV
ncbi:MAG TPA: helicase C-terminal domain-containing protein [Candidatus Dormibacteraeota bacterium]